MSLILIIEDSPPMAEAAAEALRSAGFEVISRLSVSEAVSAAQEHRPDLVVTEYFVAEATGFEVLERLARLENPPPVVVATGRGGEDVAARALALGAYSYVLKEENYLRELPLLARRFLDEAGLRRQGREREKTMSRLAAQNELAGWMAHNFKNILAASLGYLNLINFSNPDQEQDKRAAYLAESRKSQETAIELLERLMSMTETGSEAVAERLIVAEVVEEAWAAAVKAVLASTESQYPERLEDTRAKIGQVVMMNAARRLAPVTLVRSDLFSILMSLIRNALEAVMGLNEPRVLIYGETRDQRLELTVKDNGRGMSDKVMKRALEPLFSTKGEVGVGLGLSLTASLIERHDGSLDLKSTPGAGTVVSLTLPLADGGRARTN